MSDLFDGLPVQRHPAARITWCTYPAPEGENPAQGCLRWMGGSVDAPADCRGCVHAAVERHAREGRDG